VSQSALNGGLFLSRQLEQILPKLYEKRYPRLWAEEGLYFPATGDLEMGAQTLIEETVTQIGEASIMSDRATDIPAAETIIDETPFKAVCVSIHVNYTIPELAAAQKAGRDLRSIRMSSADRAIKEKIHKLAVFGSAKHGMTGIVNNPNVTAVDSSYDADNGATTVDDHISFVADNIIKVENDTNLVEGIDTILVPAKLHNIWSKARVTNTSQSVINYLLENFGPSAGGSLRNIIKVNECRNDQLVANGVTLSGVNDDRVVFLPVTPDAGERKFYGMQTLEPQLMGMDYKVFMYAGTSEAIIHYPGSMLYVDIPKL
jgi:hypothetical protein